MPASTSTENIEKNAVQVDVLPVSFVIFELIQDGEQLDFAAQPAARQVIIVIRVPWVVQDSFRPTNADGCSVIHVCCIVFCGKVTHTHSLRRIASLKATVCHATNPEGHVYLS